MARFPVTVEVECGDVNCEKCRFAVGNWCCLYRTTVHCEGFVGYRIRKCIAAEAAHKEAAAHD